MDVYRRGLSPGSQNTVICLKNTLSLTERLQGVTQACVILTEGQTEAKESCCNFKARKKSVILRTTETFVIIYSNHSVSWILKRVQEEAHIPEGMN